MSGTYIPAIVCDQCRAHRVIGSPDQTIAAVRRRARRKGWTDTITGDDLCAACSINRTMKEPTR